MMEKLKSISEKFLKPITKPTTIICFLLATLYLGASGYVKDHKASIILDEIIKEVCFAVYVSVIMWAIFEYQKSSEEENHWNRRLSEIGKHVFYAMFGRKLPDNYIDQVMLCSLNSKLYRENFEARYHIYDDKLGDEKSLLIISDVNYTVRNVSNSPCEYPLNIIIPSPTDKSLRDKVKITSFELSSNEGGISTPINKKTMDEEFEQKLERGDERVEYSVGGITIPPKSSISVKIVMNIVKPEDGSDFLEMLMPCNNMKISIIDLCKNKKKIDARSIHSNEIIKRSISGTEEIEFSIVNPIMPHQGIYWWWKNK